MPPYLYASAIKPKTINDVFKKVKRESESGLFTLILSLCIKQACGFQQAKLN
jgi:hypothetical protein